MTLSGMMNALADIQRRGDLMLEGVRNKLNHPANPLSIKHLLLIKKVSKILPPIFTSLNRYRIYVIILTGEKLSSIYIANKDLINWSVRSSSRRVGVKKVGWELF